MEEIKTFAASLLSLDVLLPILLQSFVYLIAITLIYTFYLITTRPYLSANGQRRRIKVLLNERAKLRKQISLFQGEIDSYLPKTENTVEVVPLEMEVTVAPTESISPEVPTIKPEVKV